MGRKNKLVIDTNLWISWLIGKKQTHLNRILTDETIEIFSSIEQVNELFKVLERNKFTKYISSEIADEFKLFFVEAVSIVTVKIKVHASRDPKDDFLLALVKTIRSDFLLTGDKDLLELKKFDAARIITLTEYLNLK